MTRAWPAMAACAVAALVVGDPAAASCAAWRVGPELSLREADGWTMVQLRQHGDQLSGTARRPGRGDASVTGRVQPQRIWLKVAWPDGGQILEGTIGDSGVVSGTRVSQDGRQDGATWEAMEPLQCIAMAAGPQGMSGSSAGPGNPSLNEFTGAVRDIIGILRGDQPQPQSQSAPVQSPSPVSSSAGSVDPFGSPAPASQGSADPFGSPPANSQGGSADPFGPAPAPTGGQSDDPFGPPPTGSGSADPPPAEYGQVEVPVGTPPSTRPPRALPPSAYKERPIANAPSAGGGGTASTPIILIPIGPLSDNCASGFVWREARPSDHVCVPPDARERVKAENAASRQFRDNQTISLCIGGYVWREAYDGDRTCVTQAAHNLAAEENRLGPSRKARN